MCWESIENRQKPKSAIKPAIKYNICYFCVDYLVLLDKGMKRCRCVVNLVYRFRLINRPFNNLNIFTFIKSVWSNQIIVSKPQIIVENSVKLLSPIFCCFSSRPKMSKINGKLSLGEKVIYVLWNQSHRWMLWLHKRWITWNWFAWPLIFHHHFFFAFFA